MNKSILQKIKRWFSRNKTQIIICLIIFIIAFLPRVLNLTGHSLFVDELKWHKRARILGTALKNFDLVLLKKGWWDFKETIAIGLPATVLMTASRFILKNITSPEFSFRFPIAVIGSLTAAAFYLILNRLKKPRIGIIGALFLALEPVFIAISRWAHQDAMLTFLFLLTIGLFYIGETEQKFKFKVASAFFFALAFLTKLNALAIPVILVAWKVHRHIRISKGMERFNFIKAFQLKELILPFVSLLAIVVMWPALWGNPFVIGLSYFKNQAATLSSYGHSNLFLGQPTNRPPFYYYPVILFIRLSPMALVALALGLGSIFYADKKKNFSDLWWLNLFWLVLYIAIVTLSPKKIEVRYIAAIWPAVAYFVASGLYYGFKMIPLLGRKGFATTVAVLLIVVFQVPVILAYNPSYYLYYNSFVGGPSGARRSKITLVGPGESTKYLADYITKNFSGKNLRYVHYGEYKPLLYYMTPELKKMYTTSLPKFSSRAEIRKFFLRGDIDMLLSGNYDVVSMESQWPDRNLGPSVDEILDTGQYRLAHTVRIAGTELGWVFVRKSGVRN